MNLSAFIKSILFLFSFFSTAVTVAKAEPQILPENAYRDPTISTTIFEDPYTGFLFRDDNRVVGNIATNIPLLSFNEGKDQIFLQASVESSLRDAGVTLYAETLDMRIGMNWTHPLADHWWVTAGLQHMSGHVMDDVIEKSLIPLNMGIDEIPFRLVYRDKNGIKSGLHLSLDTGRSDPASRFVAGGVFGEYHFSHDEAGDGFYVGTNLYFAENLNIGLSTTTEAGYVYHRMHCLLGYHSGADPRLKQEMFLGTTAYFWFAGFRYEI